MNLNDKIRLLRKERGWTMQELADRAELSKGYISMLEKGENPQTKKPIILSLETTQKLAHAFGLELDDFLSNVEDNISLPNLTTRNANDPKEREYINKYITLENRHKAKVNDVIDQELSIQILETGKGSEFAKTLNKSDKKSIITGRRSAAGAIIEVDDDLAELEVVSSSMIPKGADELVEITGDSMEPVIHKGDNVYIRHQPDVENGEIAIIRLENQGVTCKRVYKEEGKLILRSENSKYEDIVIEKDEAVILAKVLI